MLPEQTLPERRSEIEERIADRIDAAAGEALAAELSAVPERGDRWYGQLLVISHDAVVATPNPASASSRDAALTAATAIELLREYWVMRERLLVRLDGGDLDRSGRELTTRLLASDFLFTSAYSTLGSLRDERTAECVEAFATAAESMVAAFDDDRPRSTLPPETFCAFADATAGALGRGAAVVGATLAGAGEVETERLAAVGRGVAAARRVPRTLGENAGEKSSPGPRSTSPQEDLEGARVESSASDSPRLREFAARRLDEAERALDALAETATVDALAAFVDADRAVER